MSKNSNSRQKRRNQFSMKELLNEHQDQDSVGQSKSRSSLDAPAIEYNEEFNNKISSYNEEIYNINPKYSSIKPRFDVLVRVFLKEVYKDESGLLLPHTLPVKVPTQSGIPGTHVGYVENPFPYSQKAVVVSVPSEITDIAPGDTVYLNKMQVVAHTEGKSDNAFIDIPNKFVHPDESNKYFSGVPYDPADDNYGYLLIPSYDIKIKI